MTDTRFKQRRDQRRIRLAPCAGTSTPTGSRCWTPASEPTASASTASGPGTTSTQSSARQTARCSRATWRSRVGAGDVARPDRADGRRQSVPQPGPDGKDGHCPGSHQQRAGVPGHRLGVERRRGHDFGIEFGESPGERLRWLREALPVMRGMLHGERAFGRRAALRDRRRAQRSATGPGAPAAPRWWRRRERHVCASLPVTGTRTTSASLPGIDGFKRKEEALRRHCEELGRDEREIERTVNTGPIIIRDSHEEAARVLEEIYEHNGRAETWAGRPASAQPTGTPDEIVELLLPFV